MHCVGWRRPNNPENTMAKAAKRAKVYQRPERIRKPKNRAEARNMIRRANAMLKAAGAR